VPIILQGELLSFYYREAACAVSAEFWRSCGLPWAPRVFSVVNPAGKHAYDGLTSGQSTTLRRSMITSFCQIFPISPAVRSSRSSTASRFSHGIAKAGRLNLAIDKHGEALVSIQPHPAGQTQGRRS